MQDDSWIRKPCNFSLWRVCSLVDEFLSGHRAGESILYVAHSQLPRVSSIFQDGAMVGGLALDIGHRISCCFFHGRMENLRGVGLLPERAIHRV